MALAERIDANRWQLSPSMEQTLAAMGERDDILRTMHRAMKGEQRELVTDPPADAPVIGRIAAKGLDDELHDRPRSEEHTAELQSLMRISYAVFSLKQKKN